MAKFLARWRTWTRQGSERIPGRVYLLVAVMIFATANSVVRRLTELGVQHPTIDGRNPISFCNVLFVGNLTALVALLLLYGRRVWRADQWQFSRREWAALLAVAVLSGALAPAATFGALALTSVNNVILVGRIEPPLLLVLSAILFRLRVGWLTVAGSVMASLGVVATIALQPSPQPLMAGSMGIGRGEALAAIGAIATVLASLASRYALRRVPLGSFSLLRTGVGTLVFGSIVLVVFGPQHFMDIGSPFLWQWMLVYGAGIIVGGQLCWFTGLPRSTPGEVSLASAVSPLAGILAAYAILGEAPNGAQYIGGALILVGIGLNLLETLGQEDRLRRWWRRRKPGVGASLAEQQARSPTEADLSVGYKGI